MIILVATIIAITIFTGLLVSYTIVATKNRPLRAQAKNHSIYNYRSDY